MANLTLLLCLCALLPLIHGANILVYIGMGSYSHRVPIQPYVNALAEQGHKVTFLSGFPPKKPNPKVTEFHPPKLLEWTELLIKSEELDVFKLRESSRIIMLWFTLPLLGLQACEALYTDPVFIKWVNDPKTQFDVVVFDSLCNECAYGLAHHFKAKIIAFNTGQLYPWNFESNYGLPDESSSISDGMTHNPPNMNFFQRTVTALVPLVWKAYRELWFFPKLEEITKSGLGLKEIPSFKELEQNTSLFLVNNHWAIEYPRALPPNVIPVGGIAWHGDAKAKPLPKNLEDFIKKGKDGFIYVSFGTVAEFTKFKPDVREAVIKAMGNFPNIRFIMKSTYPVQDKLPENVLVDKWLPQADILNHPKIKLYLTHAGLGGMYEAIFAKVPMICFPVFAEQEFNADLMVNKGYAEKLELTTLTEAQITKAIGKIVGDPSYKKQVEKTSKMFTDRPMKPLDSAIWWTEFILRNEDSGEFLRPPSVSQSWWVRRQLDVWLALFLVTIVSASISLSMLYCLVRCTCRRVCGVGGGDSSRKSKLKRN